MAGNWDNFDNDMTMMELLQDCKIGITIASNQVNVERGI